MFSAIFGQRIIRRRLAAFHKAASLAWEEEELVDIAALVCHSSGCIKRIAGINKKISNSQAVFENGASITSTRMFRSNAMGLANSSRNEETMSTPPSDWWFSFGSSCFPSNLSKNWKLSTKSSQILFQPLNASWRSAEVSLRTSSKTTSSSSSDKSAKVIGTAEEFAILRANLDWCRMLWKVHPKNPWFYNHQLLFVTK